MDLAIAVQTADCVPILIVDPRTGAVAAAHAGWRGLAARVPEGCVSALARQFGSRAADLIAAIGPAIGACCYQVGVEVRESFRASFPVGEWTRWFHDVPIATAANPPMPRIEIGRAARSDRWYLDTWTAAREQLEAAGLSKSQIYSADLCTASHPAVFCSYRRDGAPAGRMAAAIAPGRIR
jgi:hypothetical protein